MGVADKLRTPSHYWDVWLESYEKYPKARRALLHIFFRLHGDDFSYLTAEQFLIDINMRFNNADLINDTLAKLGREYEEVLALGDKYDGR